MGQFTSLRTRLLLLLVAATVPAFVAIGYMGFVQHEAAAQSAEREALDLVRMAAREQELLIASTRQLLTDAGSRQEVRPQNPAACRRMMAALHARYRYYANLGAATPDGRVYCSAVTRAQPVNIADRSYFRRAVQARDFAVGDYQIGRITGRSGINFGYPIYDARKELLAVVYAALDVSWLKQLVSRVALPDGSAVTLVDGSGTVLARHPDAGRWIGRNTSEAPLIQALLASTGERTAELEGLDREKRLYAFAPLLPQAVAEGAYISVGIPTAVAFAPARATFARSLLLLFATALMAFAAAWIGSNALVLRRLHALTAAVQRLARGDMSARSGLPHGNEEFGTLARHFDDMASALQRVTRALKTLSAGNRTLVRASEEPALLEQMCRVIVEVGGYPLAWVGVAEQSEAHAIRPVAQAGHEGGLEGLLREMGPITWRDAERGQGPAATAIRTARVCVVRDVLNDPGMTPWRARSEERRHAAAAAFPLSVEGAVIGVLVIYARDRAAFDAEEMSLLEEAAEDLAFGIASLRTRAAHAEAHRTIEHMAYYDSLTGLANHAHFEERLKHLLAENPHGELAVMLLGINRFRDINEALGFNEGDKLLRALGGRLGDALERGAFIARVRADEFGVLLPAGSAAKAVDAAVRIRRALDAPFVLGGIAVDVTAAIGIALCPHHGRDVKTLIRKADVAMQGAKRSGDGYALYSAEHERDTAEQLVLARELRRAIEGGELVLHYQPKVRMGAREICGLEALIRWRHPERGLVSPAAFIPLAERTGLIKPLTDWALTAALQQAAAWHEAGIELPIAVNLSARNVEDAELLDKLQGMMQAWGAGARWLELEITESVIMENIEEIVSKLRALKEMGLAVAVDDFGTGYSSLAYLANLPLDAVKIDRSFISKVHESAESRSVVATIISLAHSLRLRVVAEGVEEEAQARTLHTLRCDEMQGFLFSKPLPPEEIAGFVAQAGRSHRRSRA